VAAAAVVVVVVDVLSGPMDNRKTALKATRAITSTCVQASCSMVQIFALELGQHLNLSATFVAAGRFHGAWASPRCPQVEACPHPSS
jgi:hypothetical protein